MRVNFRITEIPIHKLLNLPPEKETLLEDTHFRSPGKILLLSIFLGVTGLDRFLIGNLWQRLWQTSDRRAARDMVYCRLVPDHPGATKRYNMNKLMTILS